jgi:hypothetical protein
MLLAKKKRPLKRPLLTGSIVIIPGCVGLGAGFTATIHIFRGISAFIHHRR